MTRHWAYLFAVAVLLASSVPLTAQQETIAELRARADAGDAEAQNDLGVMYDNGKVLPQNFVQAAVWYRKGAAQGHRVSELFLDRMYKTGVAWRRTTPN